jgi:hypothetical protein
MPHYTVIVVLQRYYQAVAALQAQHVHCASEEAIPTWLIKAYVVPNSAAFAACDTHQQWLAQHTQCAITLMRRDAQVRACNALAFMQHTHTP